MEKVIKTLCRMCDDHCGIDVTVDEDKLISIQGNKEHSWNRGRVCIKGSRGVDMVTSEKRIMKPLKKTEDGFVEIELEQALDEIAEKMKFIQKTYGDASVGIWKGEAIGFAQQEEVARRFIHAIGSPNYFSNDSECFAGRWLGYSLVYGRWNAQPDFENAKTIVVWGGNPPHAHPNMTQQINRAREKGAKLVVIDPRYSAIARQADLFIQVKPGSDGALAWGVAKELIDKGYLAYDFIRDYTIGFDELKEYAQKFDYDYVAQETGMDAATMIPEFAEMIKESMSATVFYVGNGLEHHENGINNIRAVANLDGLVAAVDAKGGNYSPIGLPMGELTLYHEKPLKELHPIGADRFPVLYDFRQECHTMTLMDTILSEKPYPFKGLILAGANPVLTNPNTNKVRAALCALDLFVVRELFMTETAELADYILPAASYLERSEFHGHGGKQVMTLTTRIFEPADGVQDEYQFLHDIAHRMGAGAYFPWENEDALNEWLIKDTGVSMETFKANPSGYNYAEPQYAKYADNVAKGKKAFDTPSGKLEFTSTYLKDLGYQELAEYFPPASNVVDPEYPMTMITGARKVMYYHGRNRNIDSLRSALPEGEVEISKADALKMDIQTGDWIRVTSKIGTMEIKAKVMEKIEISEGQIQITHGWKETNVNLITHDDRFDPISGFPLMKAVQVKIEKM